MKIDTKKLSNTIGSPCDSSIIVNPNHFLVENVGNDQTIVSPDIHHTTSTTPATDYSSLGRQVKYIPTIVLTPVLTSKRLEVQKSEEKNSCCPRPLLDSDEVLELNQKLQKLLRLDNANEDTTKQIKIAASTNFHATNIKEEDTKIDDYATVSCDSKQTEDKDDKQRNTASKDCSKRSKQIRSNDAAPASNSHEMKLHTAIAKHNGTESTEIEKSFLRRLFTSFLSDKAETQDKKSNDA